MKEYAATRKFEGKTFYLWSHEEFGRDVERIKQNVHKFYKEQQRPVKIRAVPVSDGWLLYVDTKYIKHSSYFADKVSSKWHSGDIVIFKRTNGLWLVKKVFKDPQMYGHNGDMLRVSQLGTKSKATYDFDASEAKKAEPASYVTGGF